MAMTASFDLHGALRCRRRPAMSVAGVSASVMSPGLKARVRLSTNGDHSSRKLLHRSQPHPIGGGLLPGPFSAC